MHAGYRHVAYGLSLRADAPARGEKQAVGKNTYNEALRKGSGTRAGVFPARSFSVLASREGAHAQKHEIADDRRVGCQSVVWLRGRVPPDPICFLTWEESYLKLEDPQ